MTKREKIQKEVIQEISHNFFRPSILYFAEVGTGIGKSYIALQSAKNILKQTGRSVLISTNNNSLVNGLLSENKKHNILDDNDIAILIGARQYVSYEKIADQEFLKNIGLKIEDVKHWYNNTPENMHFASTFIEHFAIDEDYLDFISLNVNSLPKEHPLKIFNRIDQIVDEPKVYLTNHSFLLTLYNLYSRMHNKKLKIEDESKKPTTQEEADEIEEKEDMTKYDTLENITKLPIILDEVHTLNNTAQMLFSNNFSVFLARGYINTICKDDKISKKDKTIFQTAVFSLNKLMEQFHNFDQKQENEYINLLFELKESKILNEVTKVLTKINKKKNLLPTTYNRISMLKREIHEFVAITQEVYRPYINITISPNKKYPNFSMLETNPTSKLRNIFFSKNQGFIAGISGALKIGESNSIEDNRWALERIGVYQYNRLSSNIALAEEQMCFNRRIVASIYFTVKERLFSKEQAIYYIFSEKKYLPPRRPDKKKYSEKTYEQLEKEWIKNLADGMSKGFVGNVLVLMSSFHNCQLLANELQKIQEVTDDYHILYSQRGVTLTQLQRKYYKSIQDTKKHTVLIGDLSFYTGVNLVDPLTGKNTIKTMVIGKLPFEPMNLYSKVRYGSSSTIFNNYMKAVLTFRQGLGRSVRSEEDLPYLLICDPRINDKRHSRFKYFLEEFAISHEKARS